MCRGTRECPPPIVDGFDDWRADQGTPDFPTLFRVGVQLQKEKEEIAKQKELGNKREEQIERAMFATTRGVLVGTIEERGYFSGYDREVEEAYSRRQDVHEDELLTESETGKQILKLRQEEASVLDAVWLATSPKQVRLLWEKAAQFLGEENSQLIKDALAIDPE